MENTSGQLKDKLNYSSYDVWFPASYIPIIRKQDYKSGYIRRYFITKANCVENIEINIKDYNAVDASFFNRGSLLWKITGPKHSTFQNNILQQTGVVEYNSYQIVNLQAKMPGLNQILQNTTQFWRGY